MKLALLCIAGAIFLLLFLAWCITQIHFRIGSRHLKVVLFGLTIRRVSLSNIASASKREPKGMAERWYSTLKTSHRLLSIERKKGPLKWFCITPQNRYVFLSDLKRAVRRVDPHADWAALSNAAESPTDPASANETPPLEQSGITGTENENKATPTP